MGQNEINPAVSGNVIPAKDVVLEFKVANEVQSIIDLDIKDAEAVEEEIRKLHLEATIAKSIEQLDDVEARFADLKTKLNEVITNYKNTGIEKIMDDIPTGDVGKTVGRYKTEKESEFIIAKITHQAFNVPVLIKHIVSLENIADNLERKLSEQKMVIENPEKKWEVAEAQSFNINKEALKLKSTFEQQEKYIEQVKKDIVAAPVEEQINTHLKGIETLTKKLAIAVDAYANGAVNINNIIGLSVAVGMIDNLVRGLINVIVLETEDSQINYISYGEEIKNHLNGFVLVDAVNNDAITQLQLARVEMDQTFGGLTNKYPVIVSIVGEMIRLNDILKQKEKVIYQAKQTR